MRTRKSGKTITGDEKVREENWPDILLEFMSDVERGTPGWMAKDLACDYLAYAFIPSQTCHLLPFLALRSAWRKHGDTWKWKGENRVDGFSIINAQNEDRGRRWTTRSVGVPTPFVLSAIHEALTVTWTSPDYSEDEG